MPIGCLNLLLDRTRYRRRCPSMYIVTHVLVLLDVVSRASSAISITPPHVVAEAVRSILKMRAYRAGTWIHTRWCYAAGGFFLASTSTLLSYSALLFLQVLRCVPFGGPHRRQVYISSVDHNGFILVCIVDMLPEMLFFMACLLNMYQVYSLLLHMLQGGDWRQIRWDENTTHTDTKLSSNICYYVYLPACLVTKLPHSWP